MTARPVRACTGIQRVYNGELSFKLVDSLQQSLNIPESESLVSLVRM